MEAVELVWAPPPRELHGDMPGDLTALVRSGALDGAPGAPMDATALVRASVARVQRPLGKGEEAGRGSQGE